MPSNFCESDTPMLLDEVSFIIKQLNNDEYQQIVNLERNSQALKDIYCRCESLFCVRTFDNELQTVETLVEHLFLYGSSLEVFLPTRVSIGRSCSIANFNLYGYLCKLANKYKELFRFRKELLKKWEQVLFMLVVEEVYQLIVDNSEIEMQIRKIAAVKLISLWEYRDNSENVSFAVNIIGLWKSRSTIIPIFGTMLGTFELMQLSSLLSIRWHDFLKTQGKNLEMLQALEEYIFGLSSNQIKKVRIFMNEKNISTIDNVEIKSILGPENPLCPSFEEDPRQMYDFFRKRVNCETGTRSTIEELFMVYLLSESLYEKNNTWAKFSGNNQQASYAIVKKP